MDAKIIFFILVVSVITLSDGFLLEKNNTGFGTTLTDQRYFHLLGIITAEKENAKQMEQFILKLNNEVKLLQQVSGLSHVGNGSSQEMSDLKNGYSLLQKELKTLNQEYVLVKQELMQVKNDNNNLAQELIQMKYDNQALQSDIYSCRNDTKKLKTELEIFTHSISAGNLKNITQIQSSIESLEHKATETTTQLNLLTSSSNARSQDFMALLNLTKDTQHKIATMKTENKNSLHDYLNITNQKIENLETRTRQSLQSNQNITNQKIDTLDTQTRQSLQIYQNSTNQKMNDVYQRITAINHTVVLTSCGNYSESLSHGSEVKFPNTKTVYGISDLGAFRSSGKFTCEVSGVYLFSVFIMSESNNAVYKMYKNNDFISYVYIFYTTSSTGSHYHTGTGIAAFNLNVGDTLHVTAYYALHMYGAYSCMTVVKIR